MSLVAEREPYGLRSVLDLDRFDGRFHLIDWPDMVCQQSEKILVETEK